MYVKVNDNTRRALQEKNDKQRYFPLLKMPCEPNGHN